MKDTSHHDPHDPLCYPDLPSHSFCTSLFWLVLDHDAFRLIPHNVRHFFQWQPPIKATIWQKKLHSIFLSRREIGGKPKHRSHTYTTCAAGMYRKSLIGQGQGHVTARPGGEDVLRVTYYAGAFRAVFCRFV
jgi:hypothetical protein